MCKRVTLAEYLRQELSQRPLSAICNNLGVRRINPNDLKDKVSIVELDENGDFLAIYRSSIQPPVVPQEPEVEKAAELEDEPSQLEVAIERVSKKHFDAPDEEPEEAEECPTSESTTESSDEK